MLFSYYRFDQLPTDTRQKWNIKSQNRLDCTLFSDPLGFNEELKKFINKKGQLFFYISQPATYVTASKKRITEIGLTNGSNFTSLFFPNVETPLAYGDYAGWGLLFDFFPDFSGFRMIAIPNGKHLIKAYLELYQDDELTPELEKIKKKLKPFFDY